MKKTISFSLGLLLLSVLAGCGGSKPPVLVQPEQTEEQEIQEAKSMKPQPIKQARASGSHPKEVGWEEEDYA